jgi:fructosamine-3-kinase
MNVAGIELVDARPVGGGDICRAFAARTASGARVFAKTLADAPVGFFEAEARGLERLRVVGGPPVPELVAVAADGLVLEWVEPGSPTQPAAESFGRALATLHLQASQTYGATTDGYVATVPMDNTPATDWPTFQAERRLWPALRAASDRGVLGPDDERAIELVISALAELAGAAQPSARVHGDLWAGNLLWGADGQVWVVDAAGAHDGHRETDLAMLSLFGAPRLAEVLAAYEEVYPRAEGWAARIPLHQIHPLLVHAYLFGGGYGGRAGDAARAVLTGAA